MSRQAMIIDLDGTLYDAEERRNRCFAGDAKDFDRWNREAELDPPHSWCIDLVESMVAAAGYFPLFVTGRDAAYEESTRKWLEGFLFLEPGMYELHMRPTGDYRKDADLKRKIYETKIKNKYHVRLCVDDRKQVVDMWRSLGLTCLQCADGDF